jgi:hypothetical protein
MSVKRDTFVARVEMKSAHEVYAGNPKEVFQEDLKVGGRTY